MSVVKERGNLVIVQFCRWKQRKNRVNENLGPYCKGLYV